MSVEQKVELVASVQKEYGLNATLAAIGLAKTSWYYHQQQKVTYSQKYAHLHPLLEEIVQAHPAYGSPRITKELQETYKQRINHKVIERLLKEGQLTEGQSKTTRSPGLTRQVVTAAGGRANLVAQLEEIGLFEVAYTDFIELVYANGQRKAYLMPIIGHRCKLVYGCASQHQFGLDGLGEGKADLATVWDRLSRDDYPSRPGRCLHRICLG